MKLKKLRVKNIRSFKDQELTFPEGSTILSGDIGSGKTSLLLAIEFALFGLQPGQRGSSLLSNGEDTGEASLELDIDGNEVVIERRLKRGSKTISQDYSSIKINGEKIESSVTEIKTKLLEILNYPQEFIKKNNILYRYTVYTPQEEMKQIILEDPETRLNILRHIFGIDKYKRIRDNLSLFTSKLREESRILQVEIKGFDEDKGRLETSIKFLKHLSEKTSIKGYELEKKVLVRKTIEKEVELLEQKIKEKENFMKEIEKANIMLLNKKDQLSDNQLSIREIEDKLARIKDVFNEEELKGVIRELMQSKDSIENLNKEYIQVSSKLQSLDMKRREDLEKKNRIFKIDICPTCLQDVSEGHRHNILNETESQLRKVENEEVTFKESLVKIDSIMQEMKKSISALENKKTSMEILKVRTEEAKFAKEKLSFITKTKQELEKDIDFLTKHMTNLKQSTLEFTKFDNIIKIKKDELKQAFQNEKNLEIELAEVKKEIELTGKEIKDLENKILETEKTKEKLIHLIEVESWLSNDFLNLISFTERNIMITLREEFSKLFNKWFSVLTTDNFFVRLDENFTPIITQGDFELDYSYLSGGERTAVALAYRLALNQTINSVLSRIKTQGLVILDEPTDGFSDNQLDKIRDILQEIKVEQLLIVSHEPKIEGFVDNVIRLKKESGHSQIIDIKA